MFSYEKYYQFNLELRLSITINSPFWLSRDGQLVALHKWVYSENSLKVNIKSWSLEVPIAVRFFSVYICFNWLTYKKWWTLVCLVSQFGILGGVKVGVCWEDDWRKVLSVRECFDWSISWWYKILLCLLSKKIISST